MMGEKALNQFNYFESIEYFQLALRYNPHYAESAFGLSKAYYFLQEYEEADIYIDRALNLDRYNTNFKIYKSRILVGLNKLQEAENLAESIIETYPNHLEARYALAEIYLLQSRQSSALGMYESSLSLSPEARKALLALIYLHDSLGNSREAAKYARMAEKAYPSDYSVRKVLFEHNTSLGHYQKALNEVRMMETIDPANDDIVMSYAFLYLLTSNSDKAVSVLLKKLPMHLEDNDYRMLLARAYYLDNRIENAIDEMAVFYNNETSSEFERLFFELISLENRKYSTQYRKYISRYYFERGESEEIDHFYDKAVLSYRRAVSLYPESDENQSAYAGILRKKGFHARSVNILEDRLIVSPDNRELSQDFEIQNSLLPVGPALRWHVNQFSERDLGRPYLKLQTFILSELDRDYRFLLSRNLVGNLVRYSLNHNYKLQFSNEEAEEVSDFSTAFRIARNNDMDYFLVLNEKTKERKVSLSASLYLADTGTLVREFAVVRSGDNHMENSINYLVNLINEYLPLTGSLIRKNNKDLLINLGTLDGVKKDDLFMVIKKGTMKPGNESPFVRYDDDYILGSCKITETDERVSSALLEKYDFFDKVKTGDQIVLVADETVRTVEELQIVIPAVEEVFRKIRDIK